MNKKRKILSVLIATTTLLGMNLLVLGKVAAADQQVSLNILVGNPTISVPAVINFPRTIIGGTTTIPTTIVLNPSDNTQTIQVLDPYTQKAFEVDLTIDNLVNQDYTCPNPPGPPCTPPPTEILPYNGLYLVTLHSNPTYDVDTDPNNSTPGNNGVYASTASYLYNPTIDHSAGTPTCSDPLNCNFSNTESIHVTSASSDPNTSDPVIIMTRPSIFPLTYPATSGIYSTGIAIRANIPPGIDPGPFKGTLTFTLDILP